MFLKSLVIKGFKSFAERAVLDFEPGITVVVGPNGSGKSNVVDAIAWVLGAQAPSAVRSQKMDDVIFAGTSRKPALGRAEVSLTIDNSSGYLPVEFNEVTISRILFRSGDSEYAINGVSCRLLDITDLLSDAGVGRNQHVIASQGQLDAILNARPEERRAIIEEAAGVLKHRKRRERSERRLLTTEANLSRVNDLLREVRRGLRPLERQAQAAARHAEIADEVRQLRVHLGGREIMSLRARVEAARARRDTVAVQSAEIEGSLVGLDADIAGAERRLATIGVREMVDAISRAETVRERARGTAAVLTERRRAVERELTQLDDRSALAILDTELEQAHSDVADAQVALEALRADDAGLRDEETAVAARRRELEVAFGDEDRSAVASGANTALIELQRELAGHRGATDQRRAELARLDARRGQLAARVERLGGEAAGFAGETDAADEAEEQLSRAVIDAEAERRGAEDTLSRTEESRRSAESEAAGWSARADVLRQALEGLRSEAGATELAGRPGVLGTMLDVVEIEAGWEEAVTAVLGDALGAVVVAGATNANAALAALVAADRAAAVLVALPGASRAGSPPQPTGSAVGTPFTQLVQVRPGLDSDVADGVESLIVSLLGNAVAVDMAWSDVVDHAVQHRDSTFVTRDGDRFAPTGWHLGAARAGVTAALLDEAVAAADAASVAKVSAREAHDAAKDRAASARKAHQQAVRAADEHEARTRQARVTAERVAREQAELAAEQAALVTDHQQLTAALADAAGRQGELALQEPVARAAAELARQRVSEQAEAFKAFDADAGEVVERRRQLDTRLSVASERLSSAEARRTNLRRSLDDAIAAGEAREGSRDGLLDRAAVTDRLSEIVAAQLDNLELHLSALSGERDQRSAAGRELGRELDGFRGARSAAEKRLGELGELSRRADLEITEVDVRLEAATETLQRDLDVDPDTACATPAPDLAEGIEPAARLRDLDRELRLLGPVNPLAVEEFAALSERHEFLESQLEDVRSSRRELVKVIRAIDEEIAATFAAAFADVDAHFRDLFATLFPGGEGSLRLTDPDDLLNTGIDVEARPSGKNVRKLSLLSGGERSMTAIALLFAIFRSRPSPFYVLDEVEAPLDDVNLRRFLDLMDTFRAEAQLICVSHQKRTMEVADCLYGVSMKPGESSKVVSEKIRNA